MGETCFAVIAGGGTAGHVLPALAVADGLVAAGIDASEIRYFGAERGLERILLPATNYQYELFDVVGLQRSWRPRQFVANLTFIPRLWRARRRAISLMRKCTPRVVVSVGGYASLPAIFAARHLGIPIVVVSYDRLPGRASQFAARWAAASAVAFPDSPLPRAELTGAPVRQEVLGVDRSRDRAAARLALGIPDDRFLLVVMGGSQGSGVLNEAVRVLVEQWRDDDALAIYHLTGERFAEEFSASIPGDAGLWYRAVGFESQMANLYAAADLLIGRGGASTVHEVAATGTPSVLVPWAASAEGHQLANCSWLSDEGAAVLVTETEIETLASVVDALRSDSERRSRISAAARAMGEIHRSGALSGLVTSVALA